MESNRISAANSARCVSRRTEITKLCQKQGRPYRCRAILAPMMLRIQEIAHSASNWNIQDATAYQGLALNFRAKLRIGCFLRQQLYLRSPAMSAAGRRRAALTKLCGVWFCKQFQTVCGSVAFNFQRTDERPFINIFINCAEKYYFRTAGPLPGIINTRPSHALRLLIHTCTIPAHNAVSDHPTRPPPSEGRDSVVTRHRHRAMP
jgi:hypothetical protein